MFLEKNRVKIINEFFVIFFFKLKCVKVFSFRYKNQTVLEISQNENSLAKLLCNVEY